MFFMVFVAEWSDRQLPSQTEKVNKTTLEAEFHTYARMGKSSLNLPLFTPQE